MRKGLFFKIALLFILVILQSSRFEIMSIYGIKPDFIMLFVCLISLYGGGIEGTVFGFLGGTIQDLLSGGLFGAGAFSKTLCGYLLDKSTKRLDIETLPVQLLLVLFFSVFDGIIIFFFHWAFDYASFFKGRFIIRILGQAIYNVLIWPFFIFIVSKCKRRMGIV